MRLVRGATEEESLAALVAEMVCLEAGSRCWGAGGALPPPHAPYPLVAVPPRTADGLPVEVHYRPAVGVVYCAPHAMREGPVVFVRRLAARLAECEGHLVARPRACAGTSAGVFRAAGGVVPGAAFFSAAAYAALPPGRPPRTPPPARAFVYGGGGPAPPAHYGRHGAFTWHFRPLGDAAQLPRFADGGSNTLPALNATAAGLLYDPEGRLALAPGAEVAALEPPAFRAEHPRLPPGLGLAEVGRLLGAGARKAGRPALVAWPEGRLSLVGPLRGAPPSRLRQRPPPLEALSPIGEAQRARLPPLDPWPVCAGCGAPAGGAAAFVLDREVARGLLVCAACWAVGAEGNGLEAVRIELPPQAEACRRGGKRLRTASLLLEARAAAVPGAPGALLLTWPGGEQLVVAPPGLGARPELDNLEVSRLSAGGVAVAADVSTIFLQRAT